MNKQESEDNKSILSRLNKDENKDTINNRIQFVKTLLKNNKLNSIINFDNTDTENFICNNQDNDSGESYDTRTVLKKRVHDITDVINQMGGTLKYIKSGTTGHTFKGEEKDKDGNIIYEYAVKVVAYSIKDKYGSMHDTRRPENAELMMIKLLSYFILKKRTPHIVLPIGTFDTNITNFTNLIADGYVNESNEKYKEFVKRYKNGEYYNNVSILISEWANRGELNSFIRKNYKKFTLTHWKVIFFQLISVLAVIQSKFSTFRHNDLKANNILVTKISNSEINYTYTVLGERYSVPNIGYQLKIWDFDFACIPGVIDNKKVLISNEWSRSINVGSKENRYYDIHYFFNTLTRKGFFPELYTDDSIPKEVKEFVLSIVPKELQNGSRVSKGGRILDNNEYTIPAKILQDNPFFDEFRTNRDKTNIYKVIERTKTVPLKQVEHKINDFLKGGDIQTVLSYATKQKSKDKIKSREDKRKEQSKNRRKEKIKQYSKDKSKEYKHVEKNKRLSKDKSKGRIHVLSKERQIKQSSKSTKRIERKKHTNKHIEQSEFDIEKILIGLKN